jgi:hypothetical protein
MFDVYEPFECKLGRSKLELSSPYYIICLT